MWTQLVADYGCGPDLKRHTDPFESRSLSCDLILPPPLSKIARDKQDEPFHDLVRPCATPVFQEIIHRCLYRTRREVFIAPTLADLDPVALPMPSKEVDAILTLTANPVYVTGRNLWLCVEQVATQILKDVLAKLVKTWDLAGPTTDRSHW
jgi:hypothetical protein